MCVRAYKCVCMCARLCVYACVRVCARVYMHACAFARVCIEEIHSMHFPFIISHTSLCECNIQSPGAVALAAALHQYRRLTVLT